MRQTFVADIRGELQDNNSHCLPGGSDEQVVERKYTDDDVNESVMSMRPSKPEADDGDDMSSVSNEGIGGHAEAAR